MLESKHLPREMILPRKALPEIEFKARRQTLFKAFAGKRGPGAWTDLKEVISYDAPTRVLVTIVTNPGAAASAIWGEIEYIDSSGTKRTENAFPGNIFKLRVGIPSNSRIGRVKMRFRNNTMSMFANPWNSVEVKIIAAEFQ